jgi:hypothetical protein
VITALSWLHYDQAAGPEALQADSPLGVAWEPPRRPRRRDPERHWRALITDLPLRATAAAIGEMGPAVAAGRREGSVRTTDVDIGRPGRWPAW